MDVFGRQCSGGRGGGGNSGHRRRPNAINYQIKKNITSQQQNALDQVLKKYDIQVERKLFNGRFHVARARSPQNRVEEDLAAEILATGAVDFAEPDHLIAPALTPNDPDFPNAWHLAKINAPAAWDVTTGNPSVLMAVLDTGVDTTHPDLLPNLQLPGFNSVAGTSDTTDVSDINGHGTSTAGILAAVGNNGIGVVGDNWQTKLLPIRITNDPTGWSYFSDMARGINYAADSGAKVVSLSFMCGYDSGIDTAAQYVRSKGGLMFVAAGNDGKDTSQPYTVYDSKGNPYTIPAFPDYPSFELIGATDHNDNRESWSNYGPAIDLMAPGDSIWTTSNGQNYTGGFGGTSAATPIAAGVAGLLFSLNPNFTPDQVENFLFSSAKGLGTTPGDDYVYGHGRVDAGAAVRAALQATGKDLPPLISGVSAINITSSGATIAWSTDKSADSLVEYGPTTSYGGTAPVSTQVTAHSVPLSGLSASTLYHYRVKSKDAAGTLATSADYTFTTTVNNVPSMTLTKDDGGIATAKSGDILTYTIQYQNTGSASATNFVIKDSIPAGTQYQTGTARANPSTGVTINDSGSPITWTFASPIAAKGSGSVSFQVKIQ